MGKFDLMSIKDRVFGNASRQKKFLKNFDDFIARAGRASAIGALGFFVVLKTDLGCFAIIPACVIAVLTFVGTIGAIDSLKRALINVFVVDGADDKVEDAKALENGFGGIVAVVVVELTLAISLYSLLLEFLP